jgi:hypothetical protein
MLAVVNSRPANFSNFSADAFGKTEIIAGKRVDEALAVDFENFSVHSTNATERGRHRFNRL